MTSCYNAVEHMYDERNKLIIIGLTGRTGSGCSTVSKILATEAYEQLSLRTVIAHSYQNFEERKFYVLDKFMQQPNKWVPFITIDVSSLILFFVFEKGLFEIGDFLNRLSQGINGERIIINGTTDIHESLKAFDQTCSKTFEVKLKEDNNEGIVSNTQFYIKDLVDYKEKFKKLLSNFQCHVIKQLNNGTEVKNKYDLYTYLMQIFANNIRSSGNPFVSDFEQTKYTILAEKISRIVEALKKEHKDSCRVCIDAIRNPYEALYLRDKYKAFYLMAINTEEESRLKRLSKLSSDEIENLDKVENANDCKLPGKQFFHQQIQSCIEIANIHVHNADVSGEMYSDLTRQLVKYIALILHPGLVTPTAIERCMQIAFSAKMNSGCLSRQVGAVVTRKDFSVQSVGWNDVPYGQLSCNLRDVHDYCVNRDPEMHSKYELENPKFLQAMQAIDKELKEAKETSPEDYCDMCTPYCFKDVYEGITNEKNQVHTRALHAEENAFLQITKYGGTGVENGFLFSTASPCELCSKKAYQLGIRKIFYIDPYPGISKDHILTFGGEGNPEMVLFQGAIGETFLELYRSRIPLKDETELRTGIKIKEVSRETFWGKK